MFKKKKFKQSEDESTFHLHGDPEEEENEHSIIKLQQSSEIIKLPFLQLFKHSQLIQEEFLNSEIIDRISQRIRQISDTYHIKEESVSIFFKLLREEDTSITNDQYCDLYKLSVIFRVKSLSKLLQNYSEKHLTDIDLMVNLLIEQESSENSGFFSDDIIFNSIENSLVNSIEKCFENEKFGELKTSIVYRIIEKSDKEKIVSDSLFKFIMKSIKERFVLFSFLDVRSLSEESFRALADVYVKAGDSAERCYFKYLPIDLLYIKELKEEKKTNESKLNDLINQLQSKISELEKEKKEQENQLNSLNSQLQSKISELEKEKKEQENQLNSLNSQLQSKIVELEKEKKEQENQLNSLNSQLQSKISELEKEKKTNESKLNDMNNQLQLKIAELEEAGEASENKIRELSELNRDLQFKIAENERKIKEASLIVEFDSNSPFKGIFDTLSNGNPAKLVSDGIVKVTSSSILRNDQRLSPANAINPRYHFTSKDEPNSWICFNFDSMEVKLSYYSIKTSDGSAKSDNNLQSWCIEGSDSGDPNGGWDVLDSKSNDKSLDGRGFSNSYKIASSRFYQYIRLRQTNVNTGRTNKLKIGLIEFFGEIQTQ